MVIIFFISIAIIVYTYVGYPMLLVFLSFIISKPVYKSQLYPVVSVIISAFNEEKNIEAKISNLLGLDYPREKLEIIIGSDGSSDQTYNIIKKLAEEHGIRYTVSFNRIGKPAMINKMAKDARGEIFIFADARQRFERDAIKKLVANFAEESVGAVSGELIIEDNVSGTGKGMGFYWEYEKFLRKAESGLGSMTGATGAIYAIRKSLFHYLPENVVLDDVYVPMNALMMNKRVVFEPEAKAYDTMTETTEKEFVRKVRTLAGNFQIFALFSDALNPFKKGLLAVELISHKFMRLMVPYFLALAFFSNIFILNKADIFNIIFFIQAIFYGIAVCGFLLEQGKIKLAGILRLFYIPYEFCALNYAAVIALLLYRSGKFDARWEK